MLRGQIKRILPTLSFAGLLFVSPASFAQQAQDTNQIETPVFRVDVIEYAERSTQAVNYRHRGGATKIDFEGTPLLKKANGEAKVEGKKGYYEIEVEFDDLTPATQFGPEYLTYVLWAVTPEGRATNLGELILNGNRGKLNVTTELQAFSMLVTAEPYFAVTQPSDTVVLENVIRRDTLGKAEVVDAKFELMKRGSYVKNIEPGTLGGRKADKNTPLELIQAENAIHLARAAGAEQYAKATIDKAVNNLRLAASYASQRNNMKPAIQSAREAVQTAEDARLITLQRAEEARLAEERRLAADRTNRANLAAAESAARAQEAAARAQAEADARRLADMNAERAALERTRAELDRAKADAAAAQASQRAESEAQARRLAEEAAQKSAIAKAEADAARQAADQARASAEAARLEASREADRLAKEREAAETARLKAVQAQEVAQRDAAELRDRLQLQLNTVLETKQTARGLIVNMSDVLFDVGQATLKPGAREKLAKVAGIIMAHPDLTLQIEGHTDSTGSDDLNQRLSENRAKSARDFLVGQGISSANVTSKGFGEAVPVATNDNAAGRQRNRRVELVISGASITQTARN